MQYELPMLGYDYTALEPYIDAKTMEIHHTKHHQGYTNKLNAVLEKYPAIADTPIEELLKTIDTLDMAEADKLSLRNNGGGYVNHKLFWEIMGPEKHIDQALLDEIISTFSTLEQFKQEFEANAKNRFGSGWSWLVRNADGALELYSTANQDSPYMQGHSPILGLDVWEHAYYLQYQNKRPDYVEAWWNVVTLI